MKLNISLTRTLPADLRGMRVAAYPAQAMIMSPCAPAQLWQVRGEDQRDSFDSVALAGCGGM